MLRKEEKEKNERRQARVYMRSGGDWDTIRKSDAKPRSEDIGDGHSGGTTRSIRLCDCQLPIAARGGKNLKLQVHRRPLWPLEKAKKRLSPQEAAKQTRDQPSIRFTSPKSDGPTDCFDIVSSTVKNG